MYPLLYHFLLEFAKTTRILDLYCKILVNFVCLITITIETCTLCAIPFWLTWYWSGLVGTTLHWVHKFEFWVLLMRKIYFNDLQSWLLSLIILLVLFHSLVTPELSRLFGWWPCKRMFCIIIFEMNFLYFHYERQPLSLLKEGHFHYLLHVLSEEKWNITNIDQQILLGHLEA